MEQLNVMGERSRVLGSFQLIHQKGKQRPRVRDMPSTPPAPNPLPQSWFNLAFLPYLSIDHSWLRKELKPTLPHPVTVDTVRDLHAHDSFSVGYFISLASRSLHSKAKAFPWITLPLPGLLTLGRAAVPFPNFTAI